MLINPKLPIGLQARRIAQVIVECGFNVSRAVKVLRPELKQPGIYGAKLLQDPCVLREIEVIMDRTERNAQKYMKSLWDAVELYESYINDPTKGPPPKHVTEVAQTAMRLLGRGYLDAKKRGDEAPQKPMVIEGLGGEIGNLTEMPAKRKDVM